MFADLGATVLCVDPDLSTPLARHLNSGKETVAVDALSRADLIVSSVAYRNGRLPVVTISPFGGTGPDAGDPAAG